MQKLWNLFQSSLRGFDSSRQLALGVCLGILIGLLPKDSLLCYAIVVLLILSTANLLCGLISSIGFSFVGLFLDPWSHQVGQFVLNYEPLVTTWTWLSALPVMPWTRFNNTVVMGSLVIGLAAFIPIYFVSYYVFESYGSVFAKRIKQNPFVKWLVGVPPASPQQS